MELTTRLGHTDDPDPVRAAETIAHQVHQDRTSCVLFFCSSTYDLDRLGPELDRVFSGVPVFGATSAGQIGERGLQRGGITAISLRSEALRVHTVFADGILEHPDAAGRLLADQVDRLRRPDWPAFGLLLSDAISRAEERLATSLYQWIGEVSIIGGSAGDDLRFEDTRVFVDGRFRRDVAGFALFETLLPFRTFKAQHFEPTDQVCVVTRSCPRERLVYEIDGLPAAEGYARLLGGDSDTIDPAKVVESPLMMSIGDEWYVRAVARVTPEGWLVMMCGIDEGEVLTVGRAADIVHALDRSLDQVDAAIGGAQVVIGCDCVLRRLEIERRDLVSAASTVLARHRVFGFHTYGEQFNSVHVNHTFTAIALGGRP